MYNSGEVNSNRRMPDEWPELMILADAALPETEFFSATSPELQTLMGQVAEWDLAKLDQNRYYAYSQMLCGVARSLADPLRRERIIKQGANSLVEWSSKDSRGEGGISGLRYNSVAAPFESLITEAYIMLSPEVQLIGDLLTVASDRRKRIKPSPDEIATQISEATRSGGSSMNRRIGNVFTGATTNLLDTVLMAISPEYRRGKLPSDEAMELLRHPRLPDIAQHACGLLLENTTAQASFIQIKDGHIAFVNPNLTDEDAGAEASEIEEKTATDKGGVGAEPSLLKLLGVEMVQEGEVATEEGEDDSYNSRKHSIICPAANIKGMVPGIVNMVVEMIEIAVKELKTKEKEIEQSSLLSI